MMWYVNAVRTSPRLVLFSVLLAAVTSCGGTAPFSALNLGDRELLAATLQTALENNRTGQGANWSNPATKSGGTVVPIRTYKGKSDSASDCREFQQTATVDGETDIAFGSACRTVDGVWRIVDISTHFHPRYTHPYDSYGRRFGYRGLYDYSYYSYRYRRHHLH
jgi:surface antigen